MKQQDDLELIGYIGKYGCFFMSIVYWLTLKVQKIELGYNHLNRLWMTALETEVNGKPILSGDLNGDGDMDDAEELLIGDKTALCKLAGLPLVYFGSFEPGNEPRGKEYFYIGEFYREWMEKGKKKSFTHFAGIDDALKCEYDPLGESMTVKLGKLKAVRVFKKV